MENHFGKLICESQSQSNPEHEERFMDYIQVDVEKAETTVTTGEAKLNTPKPTK